MIVETPKVVVLWKHGFETHTLLKEQKTNRFHSCAPPTKLQPTCRSLVVL